MSRQPSPGLAGQNQQPSYYRDQHGNPIEKSGPHIKIVYRGAEQQQNTQNQNQGAATPVPIATSSSTGRSKSRAYQSGIAAGAEDVKYAAKYRDLKQKVKEIEADNDRLAFKVLQAKRGIQRSKLERAILYERLGALPASPPQGAVPLPPQHVVQPTVSSGGQVPQHPEARAYGQPNRHHRAPGGPPPPHHHHRRHHQQPIQPAPPVHVSPPQHHATAHHPHHPPHDAAHPGQLPITHAQQVMTIETQDGPLLVVAGPDGRPVTTADGHFIPAQDIHPPSVSSGARKRGGRVNKEQRDVREREAREIRDREEMERKQALLAGGAANSSGSAVQIGGAPQGTPMSHEREREWGVERELHERDRIQRREGYEHDRERERHGHHAHHHHRTHGHHHHHHQHSAERSGSPPPPPPPPERGSSPPPPAHAHRSHSHSSHASYRSHGGQHHVHTHSQHSHSASPLLSPGGSSYPSTRIHNHQRVGPGSYVLRDRTAASDVVPPQETNTLTPVPASGTPSQNDREASANAPMPTPGVATSSRVPTPPYIARSGRTDAFNNDPDAEGRLAGGRSDAPSASEEGSGAQSVATTP